MSEGTTKPRYETADVKAAARGRWGEILSAAGIPRDSLDGKHHACPKCRDGGTNRFRLIDAQAGAVFCNQCFNKDNGDGLAAVQWTMGIRFPEALQFVAEQCGLSPATNGKSLGDPLERVAREKRTTVEALKTFGAVVDAGAVVLPMFDGDGKQCSSFRIKPGKGKGLNEKDKPSGLFLPIASGNVLKGDAVARAPQPGETWLVVEGVKDAAALWALGLLAVGLPTYFMAQKFTGLFRGVDIVLVPDRDRAGDKGAQQTGGRLFRIAASINVVVLPAEFKETEGADTRDVLAMPDGEQLLRKAIEAATPWKSASENALVIDSSTVPVSQTMADITTSLLASGHIYNRAGQVIVIEDDNATALLGAQQLAGMLNTITEVVVRSEKGDKFEPLPVKYGNVWLCHPSELQRLPEVTVFTRHPVCDDDGTFAAPGFNEQSGVYYCGPAITPTYTRDTLDRVLSEFCWKSPADRTNFIGVLITSFFAKRFIGSKPCLLLNGNQPGLGKSILAQLVAILRDGKKVTTASYNVDDVEFEKTLGAQVKDGLTTLVVDNAKARGRSAVIDSAVLERSITDAVLCYRLLGQSATIRAENSHQFIITANSAEVSRDLITRSIVVGLHYEGAPERRSFEIPNIEEFVHENRETLLSELAGYVDRWMRAGRPEADVATRFNKAGWGRIVGGILNANGEPDFLANHEEVAGAMDHTLGQFAELVGIMALDARGTWTAAELVAKADERRLFASELHERTTRSKATVLGIIATRYVGERFRIDDAEFVFEKVPRRNGAEYQVRDYTPVSTVNAEP